MSLEVMNAILDTIKQYDRIVIFRHKRPDGDAVGSSMGLRGILRATYPQKEIVVINNDFSDYVAFLGEEDGPQDDEYFRDALGIVVDTGTTARISNPQYALCQKLIKIDHHIPLEPYGDLQWVEEERSSCCEMIATFYQTFASELVLTKEAATCVYTGMVTDSGRFRFREVSPDTLRAAATLLETGIDLETLYARLYMKDFEVFKFRAHVYDQMQISENGVAYLYVDNATKEQFGLTHEQASASVSYLENIRGSLIWLAFIEAEGEIRVRLRSRFVTVSELAERYGGGGHACAAGAFVRNAEEMNKLIAEADALLKEYKETHEGWL